MPGRVLGVDVGARRIGLAISDPSGTLARPLRTLTIGGIEQAAGALAAEIAALSAEDDGLAGVVIGLPAHLDGTPSDETFKVLKLADRLSARVAVPIDFEDERLTSREAEGRLAIRERDWKVRKARLDAAAAAVILQEYLHRTRPAKPSGREG